MDEYFCSYSESANDAVIFESKITVSKSFLPAPLIESLLHVQLRRGEIITSSTLTILVIVFQRMCCHISINCNHRMSEKHHANETGSSGVS